MKLREGEKPVARKRFLAELVWQAATTGQAEMPGKTLTIGPDDWFEIVKFIYTHIDGAAKSSVELTGAGGGPVEIKQADREQATRELTEWQQEQLKRLNEQSAGMQTPTA